MKKKTLLFLIFAMLFFIGINNVNAEADCSKYACVTCNYVDGNFDLKYDVKANGDGTATMTFKSSMINTSTGYATTYTNTLTSSNFINKSTNKLSCPSKIYFGNKGGGRNGAFATISATAFENDKTPPANLESTSTNNNKTLTAEQTSNTPAAPTTLSCDYTGQIIGGAAGVSGTIKATLVSNGTKLVSTTFTNDYKLNSNYDTTNIAKLFDIKNKKCPSLFIKCGSSGSDKYCSISTEDVVHPGVEPQEGEESDDAEKLEEQNGENNKEQENNLKIDLDTSTVGCAIFGDELISYMQTILDYIRIIGVVLAVVLGILDYVKAVFGSDEKSMAKANKNFSTRMIAVGLLFLVPTVLNFLLTLFNIKNTGAEGTCGLI